MLKRQTTNREKIWSFVAFNLYVLFLISAFSENTAWLFDASLIKEMKLAGMSISPNEWGWGNHYIWRLVAAIVVTAVAGFLAGAIAKNKGALTTAISNIPSVLFWIFFIYLYGFSGEPLEEKTAFIIIAIIAIPLTTYIAFIAGGFGEEIQEVFEDNTILGIKPYHWIWAIYPIYWYALGIVDVAVKCIVFRFTFGGDLSIVTVIMMLLVLLPVLAWVYPLLLVYRVLTGEILSEKSRFIQGIANFGILILGIVIAKGLQSVIYSLLANIVS